MIIGIRGLPGSGKSYYMTASIIKLLRRDKRAKIVSNYHPTERALEEFGDRWRFGLWVDMLEAEEHTVCVVDEANMWFSSRDWKGQSSGDLAVFKQSRKNGISLWWCDQHENRVDVAIREVTHWYYSVERFFVFSYVRILDPCTGKPCGVEPFIRSPRIWAYYDSYEKIGLRDGSGYGRGRMSDARMRPESDQRLYRYEDEWSLPFYRRGPILGRSGEMVIQGRRSRSRRGGGAARYEEVIR